MAASILSQDILAICLFHVDGNIDLSMEEVIDRVENYQIEQNRHYGISRSDFRGLFLNWFIFNLGIKQLNKEIGDIKFGDIIPDILKFHYAHFNDEGEYWIKGNDRCIGESYYAEVKRYYGYDKKKYQEKLKIKKEMNRYVEHQKMITLNTESVRKFYGKTRNNRGYFIP